MKAYSHNVADVFRSIVDQHPDRPALIWSAGGVVTFAELDALSNQAARFLEQHGVHQGDTVCIRLDKCTLAYALIVACLKAGAPYFVVDPFSPAARLAQILGKCRPRLVFSAESPRFDAGEYCVITIDGRNSLAILAGLPAESFTPRTDILGTDPAYIMFTSGSTGAPKGAVMSHANLLNFIPWARHEFSITPDDVFTGLNPLYFDNSVFDFHASLMNGAALVPFDAAIMKDPYAILRRIEEMRCTIYFSVPSLLIYFQTLKMITPEAFARVRAIIFGGEGYPKSKLKEVFDCFHARSELVNVYGPTECTCICSAYRLTEADFEDLDGYPPLGGPIANFAFAILNQQGEPAAPGELGEIYLGGPSVGLGYFNDPELTQDAFRQNALNQRHHERLYRTGDLVRISKEDGKLYFAGRKDNQIKHQGHRVELGEIEHALCRIAGVEEAVAVHSLRDGISRIIGVIAATGSLTPEAVRQEVSRMVPAYMVPARVDVLDRLPKNGNGKIDRKLLQARYS